MEQNYDTHIHSNAQQTLTATLSNNKLYTKMRSVKTKDELLN